MAIFSKEGQRNQPEAKYFDVHYGIASQAITLGLSIVATTACDYHGFTLVSSNNGALVIIYDSTATEAGNILDAVLMGNNETARENRTIPIKARMGIVVSMTSGTGTFGTVLYAPRG